MRKICFNYLRDGVRMMGSFVGRTSGPIFAQRIFRGYRVFQLHSKLWAEHVKNLAIKNGHPNPNSKKWLLSFALYSICQPDLKISNDEIENHLKDLDYIHDLTKATIVCPNCSERLILDKRIPKIKYCSCKLPVANTENIKKYPWTPFMETPDFIIWRQPHPKKSDLYMYKVYGYYDDISSDEFLATQLDIDYRKKWDNSVIKLEIVEEDNESDTKIIYWEMAWPLKFSNRDYCFARRHLINENGKESVIMNKAISHSSCPVKKENVRVKDYYSVMHIRAANEMNEPGVEFGLTYFDDPGLALPSWLSKWAAMSGIPDFLNDVRKAARARREKENKIKPNIKDSSVSSREILNSTTTIEINTKKNEKEDLAQYFKRNILTQS